MIVLLRKVREVLLIVPILLACSLSSFAQHAVTGTVTNDSNGDTMPGVNVLVKGTTTGSATDADGIYRLEAPSGQDTLVFSFIGFQRLEVPIDNRSTINVALTPEVFGGEDVVVIGYGTTTQRDLTGSVSSVSSDEWESASINTPDQVLQGRISGVKVTTNSHEPGGGRH